MSRFRLLLALALTGLLVFASAAQADQLVRYRFVGGNAAPPRPDLRVQTSGAAVLKYGDTSNFVLPAAQLRTLKQRVTAVKKAKVKSTYRSRLPSGDVGADLVYVGRRRITVEGGASGVPRPLRRLISLLEQIVRQHD